jgi:L-2-hydroxyglutarate oxidase
METYDFAIVGGGMDDFLIVPGYKSIHVCNAPSPAATAAIPIGKVIAERIQKQYQ